MLLGNTLNNPNYQNSGSGIRNVQKVDRTDSRGTDNGGKVIWRTGTAIQTGGKAIQVAGAAAKVTGAGLTAAGAGLSATGVGAGVGAPMMAAGRLIGFSGSATQAGGRTVSGAGRSVRRSGAGFRLAGRGSLGAKVKMLVRLPLDLSSFLFISWLGVLWFMQFFAAVMSILMLGVGAGVTALNNIRLWGLFGGASLQDLFDLIRFVFGANVNLADHFGSLYMLFSLIALTLGFISLILVAFRSILSLESPFWGNGATIKIAAFLGAIIGYTLPLANLFPWVMLYSLTLLIYRD